MSYDTPDSAISELPATLEQARADARNRQLAYAGGVSPIDAWTLAQNGEAVLVDVRSAEERTFVGHIPGLSLIHI